METPEGSGNSLGRCSDSNGTGRTNVTSVWEVRCVCRHATQRNDSRCESAELRHARDTGTDRAAEAAAIHVARRRGRCRPAPRHSSQLPASFPPVASWSPQRTNVDEPGRCHTRGVPDPAFRHRVRAPRQYGGTSVRDGQAYLGERSRHVTSAWSSPDIQTDHLYRTPCMTAGAVCWEAPPSQCVNAEPCTGLPTEPSQRPHRALTEPWRERS
eukprot:364948-Chlamydomonas_euryale.AAC.3